MAATAVIITGTPGTGKTSIASKLGDLGYLSINLYDFAKEHDCIIGRDEERDSMVVDTDKLNACLERYLEAGYGIVIIDSHYADVVPEKYVSKCFVLSAEISALKKRLEQRGYSELKIQENIESEIMQVCWIDSLEAFGSTRVRKMEGLGLSETTKAILAYLKTISS